MILPNLLCFLYSFLPLSYNCLPSLYCFRSFNSSLSIVFCVSIFVSSHYTFSFSKSPFTSLPLTPVFCSWRANSPFICSRIMLPIKSLVTDTTDDHGSGSDAHPSNDSVNGDGNTTNVGRGEDATATVQLPSPPTTPSVPYHGLPATHSESPRCYTPTLPRHNRVASAGLRVAIPNDGDYYAYAHCRPPPQSVNYTYFAPPAGFIYPIVVPTGLMFPLALPGPMLPYPVPQFSHPPAGVIPGSFAPAGSIRPIDAPTDRMSPLSLPEPMLSPFLVPHADFMPPTGSMPPTMNHLPHIVPESTLPQGRPYNITTAIQGSTLPTMMPRISLTHLAGPNVATFTQHRAAPPAQGPSSFRHRRPNGHPILSQRWALEPKGTAPQRTICFVEPIVPPGFMANPNNHGRWRIGDSGRWHYLNALRHKRQSTQHRVS